MKKNNAITQSQEALQTVEAQTTEIQTTEVHEANYSIVLPKRNPIRDSGFTLPAVTTPTRLVVGRRDANGNEMPLPKSGDRELIPISMGNNRFVQWLDTFQGNLEMEQERLDKLGIGIQIYQVEGEQFKLDANLEWTASRGGLKANA